MKKKDDFLFFDKYKKEKILEFLHTDEVTVYIYSCIFNVKYKDKIGYTRKKSVVSTNVKIESVEDRKYLVKNYLKKHPEFEDAKVVQLILVDTKTIIKSNLLKI
jgi:hypothetical protein